MCWSFCHKFYSSFKSLDVAKKHWRQLLRRHFCFNVFFYYTALLTQFFTFARHLIKRLYGNIGRPDCFTRFIEKQFTNVVQLVVAKYKAVPAIDIEIDENELGTVKIYLLYMHRAVKSGETSSRSPGITHYSRLLITTNRILRLMLIVTSHQLYWRNLWIIL